MEKLPSPQREDCSIQTTFPFLLGVLLVVECPLWVKSRHAQRTSPCPLYPRKQTCGKRQGCPSVVQSCPLLPRGHRSDGERPIVDLCLTDFPTRTLAVKSSAFLCVIGFLRPARCNAIIFLRCATVISNAGSTRRSPTIGSPSICETAIAINSRQQDTPPGG